MIDSIQEIRKALDKDCYLAALALSLTLPDICSQVENAVMDGNRTLYINWFNSHAEYDESYLSEEESGMYTYVRAFKK